MKKVIRKRAFDIATNLCFCFAGFLAVAFVEKIAWFPALFMFFCAAAAVTTLSAAFMEGVMTDMIDEAKP